MILNRREFLKTSSLTALALGLNAFSPAIFKRRILAGAPESRKRLIFIFLRGGNDGVNTVIPRGDPAYSLANRPTLFYDETDAIDLGNGFAQLHPALAPLMEIYNHTNLNGIAGPGNLAVIHRVGYQGQSQSHFDSQQYWENGVPGQPYMEEGMFYRQIAKTMDPSNNPMAGVTLSSSQVVSMKGPIPLVTISDMNNFNFSGTPSKVQKFLGTLPSAPAGPDGKGLLGAYGGARDFPSHPYRDLVYGTGVTLTQAVGIVQDVLALGPYTPANGAVYPQGTLGTKLQQIAMLIKETPVGIIGANYGGFDTHQNEKTQHANLLRTLAQGFQALYRDLQDWWQDIVIVTMSEFGRTSKENGSLGTDHAYASCVFVAGGPVKGGVYNCDPATWAANDLFSQDGRYLKHKTDYRANLAEIFTKHFGDDAATLNEVIPGYSQAAAARPQDFASLNFL